MSENDVVFLNPHTCGIYKSGGVRYKTDPETGLRTDEIDNELIEAVEAYVNSKPSIGEAHVPLSEVFRRRVLVPTYYDKRYNQGIHDLLKINSLKGITIDELLHDGTLVMREGHGSPGNDQRTGTIPYVKVSDIRGLRINVNPTNLVSESVARRYWRGDSSRLHSWDVITPNRASSNIGEFAILLPGEEQVVLTREVFIFRVSEDSIWDPFYLLWALCLRVVREQWRRIALMQTNREDCGDRYKEIILPNPPNRSWVQHVSQPFRDYFTTIAEAKSRFLESIESDSFKYVANVASAIPDLAESEEEEN